MKMRMTSIMMVLLISLWTVNAFAQSGTQNQVKPSEPIQEQTTPRTFDGEGNATGQASQTHQESGPEAALGDSGTGAGVMDSRGTGSGSMGATGAGSTLPGDDLVKSMDNETGDQTRNHSFDEDMGFGGTARHDEFAEEGGPHGPMSGDEEDGLFKVFIDEDGDGFHDFMGMFGENGSGTLQKDGVLEVQRRSLSTIKGTGGPNSGVESFGVPSDQDNGTGTVVRVRGNNRK